VATPNHVRSDQYGPGVRSRQEEFIRLVESLNDEQWHRLGQNFPQRMNDEDEGRPVGVIAHHVATNGDYITERIQTMLAGGPLAPVNQRAVNAEHARSHSGVTKDEVLRLLRLARVAIANAVRSIPDDQLDIERSTPVGPMSGRGARRESADRSI